MMAVSVAQLQRHPVPGNHSVERIFEDVRAHLPGDIDVTVHVNEHPSTGLRNRVLDALHVRSVAADVRHITGDVHYLGWFLPRGGTLLTILDCVTLERLAGVEREVFRALWYKVPIRHAERLTTISTFSALSIERHTGYPADRICIIPPPLSGEFQLDERPFAVARPRILQVGTTANKNVPRVIEALTGLDVELVLIGHLSAEQSEALRRSGLVFENHSAIGRSALLEQYRRADIVLFASLYEGFGMPIVEAQAVGRPVITSDRCSMPEAAGEGAILVDPEDRDAIRHAVVELCRNEPLRHSLIARGLANTLRFRPGRIAADYAALYRELAP
jgi:glycosyltransferase involved in cell wall biosynthesis